MANKRPAFEFLVPDRRLVLLSTLALAGCGGLGLGPSNPDETIYRLEPETPQAAATGAAPAGYALAIDPPDALNSLDTARIALIKADGTLDYYANATWPDRLPLLIQSAVLDGFLASGRMPLASRTQDALHADYEMTIDVRDCAAHYSSPDSAPEVTVTLAVQVATAHGRQIQAGTVTSQKAVAAQNTTPAVVAAYNSALATAVADIVAWTLAQPLAAIGPGTPPVSAELSPSRRIP